MDFLYLLVGGGQSYYIDSIQIRELGGNVNPNDTDMDGMLDSWEVRVEMFRVQMSGASPQDHLHHHQRRGPAARH